MGTSILILFIRGRVTLCDMYGSPNDRYYTEVQVSMHLYMVDPRRILYIECEADLYRPWPV